MVVDRYEKRHKNLAAHVSPAFRAEVGDVVTVGMSIKIICCLSVADCEQVNAGHCQKLYDSTCFGCLRARRQPSHLESSRSLEQSGLYGVSHYCSSCYYACMQKKIDISQHIAA